LTKGAFFHILGNSDKGVAVKILASLYREKLGELFIIALGDSRNDLPMLQRADCPVAIRKPDGSHDPDLAMVQPAKTRKIGPEGWNEAIFQLQAELDKH
jgi:mannosyl-3-phosphoglycerate phosphatase